MDYQSPVEYDEVRIRAAAVYCSDGRVGEHFDDFLHNGLGLPRYDRVALPGGPARLAGYEDGTIESRSVMEELKFLVDAHGLTRIVLIQHEGCAFYKMRLDIGPNDMLTLQDADIVLAAKAIREHTGLQHVEGFYAMRSEDGLKFISIPVDEVQIPTPRLST